MFAHLDDYQPKREGPPSIYRENGELRQCNEGKYEFLFSESEDKTQIILEV